MEGIEPVTLRAAFELLAEGTVAQGARLDVEAVPARLACVRCGAEPARAIAGHEGIALEACRACGGRYRVLEGAGWSVEGVTLAA